MDVIISGNEEVMRMIKDIPLNNSMRIDEEKFMNLIKEIANRKEENEI